ncbi:hypothetical protein [Ferruginibacter sp.]
MEVKFNPAKHLYGRGWLGLIPLVGAVVGIGLMLLGIFKYRDKKLTYIGITALLFTVLIYSSAIYYTEYTEQGRKNTAAIIQPALDHLVKDIEFYKKQSGTYPDSLTQIARTDKFTFIVDPLLAGHSSINHQRFYYKKSGEKYCLFSCGVDLVAYTSDDIFPSANLFDSSLTGLIKL